MGTHGGSTPPLHDQRADMIAVLKEGKVVEKGTHETLMRIKGGAYMLH
jgi:ABC-type transport system involved in Fe-S cluster assembly fused permease/ATPase subunit